MKSLFTNDVDAWIFKRIQFGTKKPVSISAGA
jgi:hypothetical protein